MYVCVCVVDDVDDKWLISHREIVQHLNPNSFFHPDVSFSLHKTYHQSFLNQNPPNTRFHPGL